MATSARKAGTTRTGQAARRERKPRTTPLGREIVEGLKEHVTALKSGAATTVRTVTLEVELKPYGSEDVRRVRKALGMSQPVFAAFLGVKAATVRSWEQGQRGPSGMARRFLEEIEANPRYWKGRTESKLRFRHTKRSGLAPE